MFVPEIDGRPIGSPTTHQSKWRSDDRHSNFAYGDTLTFTTAPYPKIV